MRAAHDAFMLTSINDLFLYGQRGHYDYGFIGAGQLDQFGNVNTSYIGDPDHPKVRLPGSGGANDIVSSCREIFIMTRHEPRRFVERVDFITSPGYLDGPEARRAAGLVRSRPMAVVTDLALLGFDEETGQLRLDALQPGVSEDEVRTRARASSCSCRRRSASCRRPPTRSWPSCAGCATAIAVIHRRRER